MSDVYEEAFYHFVWATKQREPMIVPQMESLLHTYIRQKCQELKTFIYAMNGMPDHLHLVCSVPASIAVADFIGNIKGGSSHYMNHLDQSSPLRWQPGYGYLTFAKSDLGRVVTYVDKQKTHHVTGKLSSKMERISSAPEGLSPSSPAL